MSVTGTISLSEYLLVKVKFGLFDHILVASIRPKLCIIMMANSDSREMASKVLCGFSRPRFAISTGKAFQRACQHRIASTVEGAY